MMKRSLLAASALALVATSAQAGDFDYLDVYFVPSADVEFSDSDGSVSDDGDGFGIKGKAHIADTVTLHGEYQATTVDDFSGSTVDVDVDQLRFGFGVHSQANDSNVRFYGEVEYVDLEVEFASGGFNVAGDADGFGLRVGALFLGEGPFSGYGSIGYLDVDDTDGLEFLVGLAAEFSEGLGGFIDYRSNSFEADDGEIELSDIRLGLRVLF